MDFFEQCPTDFFQQTLTGRKHAFLTTCNFIVSIFLATPQQETVTGRKHALLTTCNYIVSMA